MSRTVSAMSSSATYWIWEAAVVRRAARSPTHANVAAKHVWVGKSEQTKHLHEGDQPLGQRRRRPRGGLRHRTGLSDGFAGDPSIHERFSVVGVPRHSGPRFDVPVGVPQDLSIMTKLSLRMAGLGHRM